MLTATILNALTICERRVWRDVYLKPARDLPGVVTLSMLTSAIMEDAVPLPEKDRPIVVRSWAEGVEQTRLAIQNRTPAIVNAYLEYAHPPITLRANVDRLERGSNGLYFPVITKQNTTILPEDVLRLEFCLWILCHLQETESLPGLFWLGVTRPNMPTEIAPHGYNPVRFEKTLQHAVALLSESEPPAVLISDCKFCPWKPDCYPEAKSRKHVSLLSKLRRDTLADLAKANIHTLDQIAAMQPDDLKRFRGIKKGAVAIHASARAWVEEQPVWYGTLDPRCETEGYYFDIETLQDGVGRTVVWSIGWCGPDGLSQTIVVGTDSRVTSAALPDGRSVTLVPDHQAAWQVFADSVAGSTLPIFHWTGYDAGVMAGSAPEAVVESLAPRLSDLCHLVDSAVKFPVKGVSLKVVAPYLGFQWKVYSDWFAAYQDYRRWLVDDDLAALASACSYQRDDVDAMVVIRRWLAEHRPRSQPTQ
jgi:hypothetical protein